LSEFLIGSQFLAPLTFAEVAAFSFCTIELTDKARTGGERRCVRFVPMFLQVSAMFCAVLYLSTRQVSLPIAVFVGSAYPARWDTLPQRRALIWKDSKNGYYDTWRAAGKPAFFIWPLCQTPHMVA
jgi:hypothetical protein